MIVDGWFGLWLVRIVICLYLWSIVGEIVNLNLKLVHSDIESLDDTQSLFLYDRLKLTKQTCITDVSAWDYSTVIACGDPQGKGSDELEWIRTSRFSLESAPAPVIIVDHEDRRRHGTELKSETTQGLLVVSGHPGDIVTLIQCMIIKISYEYVEAAFVPWISVKAIVMEAPDGSIQYTRY